MYMNKTKRNLIIASAVLNLLGVVANLVLSILLITNLELIKQYMDYFYIIGYSTNIIYAVISFAAGLVASILLLFAVRNKGKYFRTSQGVFYAGFIIIVICGGMLPWLLLFISMFVPDVIVMNTRSEVRHEERMEDRFMEAKKKKITELQKLRDEGVITEEEYKQKLFEIL